MARRRHTSRHIPSSLALPRLIHVTVALLSPARRASHRGARCPPPWPFFFLSFSGLLKEAVFQVGSGARSWRRGWEPP